MKVWDSKTKSLVNATFKEVNFMLKYIKSTIQYNMPIVFLDRVPLPTVKVYTCVSVVALSVCVYVAVQTINKSSHWNSVHHGYFFQNNSTLSLGQLIYHIFSVMAREPISVWVMINMAFCWLILLGRCIQRFIFGEIRISEQQHLKDKFWNFVFYKFIFVFGVINVQYIDEVLLWCSWFALLGFLHLVTQLSKDRFEYLSFSPTTPIWSHVKLMGLLACVFVLSGILFLVSAFAGFFGGFNTYAFMTAEVILLGIRTLHIILRYSLHLYDIRQENAHSVSTDDTSRLLAKRGPVAYYIELGFELIALIIDFIHHLHMLLWSNIFLSMASLVICMQLRYLFQEIQDRYKKHRNYLLVRHHLEKNYPMATFEELNENSDNCAICWEKMESARKLPCQHLFHNTCLQSWLEQHTSCPTCRTTLNIRSSIASGAMSQEIPEIIQPARRQLNHFFHFDGSRYVSWLPSFSVEVTHAQSLRSDINTTNSQLDANARQVQQLFPQIPLSVIIEDLRSTRSAELTVENIIDGRLVSSPIYRESENFSHQNRSNSMLLQTLSEPSTSSQLKDWEDLTSENIDTEETSSLIGRFSKSSAEREWILHKRKEHMIQLARKKYIDKQKNVALLQSTQS